MFTKEQQLCWIYQDWKRDDEYVYAVDYVVIDLLATKARKTKRTRKSFDATEEWLKKLPLNEKVEL